MVKIIPSSFPSVKSVPSVASAFVFRVNAMQKSPKSRLIRHRPAFYPPATVLAGKLEFIIF
jgi:hypothetical protein